MKTETKHLEQNTWYFFRGDLFDCKFGLAVITRHSALISWYRARPLFSPKLIPLPLCHWNSPFLRSPPRHKTMTSNPKINVIKMEITKTLTQHSSQIEFLHRLRFHIHAKINVTKWCVSRAIQPLTAPHRKYAAIIIEMDEASKLRHSVRQNNNLNSSQTIIK